MSRRTRTAITAAFSATAIAVTAAALVDFNSDSSGTGARTVSSRHDNSGTGVVVGHGSDRRPSHTATDWVTYADHVVVMTAKSQQEIPTSQEEKSRGEGSIGRTVSLKTDKVLWSRDGAPEPAPKSWKYPAAGWQFTGGDTRNRTEFALADRPRVEAGHTYIMAIAWEPARCSPGDEKQPAGWWGLGEGSEIPYDEGIMGNGELEGRTQHMSKTPRATDSSDPALGLEERMAGKRASALTAELTKAHPGKPQQFGPPPAKTRCD